MRQSHRQRRIRVRPCGPHSRHSFGPFGEGPKRRQCCLSTDMPVSGRFRVPQRLVQIGGHQLQRRHHSQAPNRAADKRPVHAGISLRASGADGRRVLAVARLGASLREPGDKGRQPVRRERRWEILGAGTSRERARLRDQSSRRHHDEDDGRAGRRRIEGTGRVFCASGPDKSSTASASSSTAGIAPTTQSIIRSRTVCWIRASSRACLTRAIAI